MKKLLITILAAVGMTMVYADKPATFPINCNNNIVINETSTLKDVQTCMISKQETSDGMYMVKFKDNNSHTYECYFAKKLATSKINHCTM